MKLNFEELVNANGLKVGDKVKILGEVFEISKSGKELYLEGKSSLRPITSLLSEFEKIEPNKTEFKRKIGDLFCDSRNCKKCPLRFTSCEAYSGKTLRENVEITLTNLPEMEVFRPCFEKQLEKEVE